MIKKKKVNDTQFSHCEIQFKIYRPRKNTPAHMSLYILNIPEFSGFLRSLFSELSKCLLL